MTDHPHLRVTVDDSRQVLTVTLANAEERNAQTPSLWRALAAAGLEGNEEAFFRLLHTWCPKT